MSAKPRSCAGLIPFLEEDCIGYRFVRDHAAGDLAETSSPVLFIRATDDPAGQIARAIVEFAARPIEYTTPSGESEAADLPAELALALGTPEPPSAAELAERLLADTSLLSNVLGRLSRPLPVTPVLVIDQAEEMFTLARSAVEEWARGRVLEMIRQVGDRRGDFKLIVSLRTEYYGRLVSALRRGLTEADGVREYLLADLDIPAMVRVIERPASRERLPHAAEIPFQKYQGFDYAEGVPEAIARQVARHGRTDGVALLLQVICAQLFERAMARVDHRITHDDLTATGGFEGALSRHAERQLERLFPADRAQLSYAARPANDEKTSDAHRPADILGRTRAVLANLRDPRTESERFQVLLAHLTLRQGDGTLTTGLLREKDLAGLWDGLTPFDELLPHACDLRLLRVTTRRLDESTDERLVSLGHDALAKVAQPWKQELDRRSERRKWKIRGGLAAAAAVVFAALSLEAMRDRNMAVRAQATALANASKANMAANEALLARDEAKQKQKLAIQAEESARSNEEKAKNSAAEALAVLNFFETKVLAAARPKGVDGGLGKDVTLREAIDASEP